MPVPQVGSEAYEVRESLESEVKQADRKRDTPMGVLVGDSLSSGVQIVPTTPEESRTQSESLSSSPLCTLISSQHSNIIQVY